MVSGAKVAAPAKEGAVERGRVNNIRVRRYFAGQEPEYPSVTRSAQPPSADGPLQYAKQDGQPQSIFDIDEVQTTAITELVDVRPAFDSRLERLQQLQITQEPPQRRHRHDEDDDDEEEGLAEPQKEADDDELAARREMIRQRLLHKQLLEAEEGEDELDDEDEEESDDGSGAATDEEEIGQRRLARPVFVPKGNRETVAEREAAEKEAQANAAKEDQRLKDRKYETLALLQQHVAYQAQQEEAQKRDPHLQWQEDEVNTDDEEDPEGDYEKWKARELSRIKRERDVRDKAAAALRGETVEREESSAAVAAPGRQHKQRSKWGFLQKYWHKGAFFQDEVDDTRGTQGKLDMGSRDYSAPTGFDKFDKSKLPKVMQVKNFGRSGQTKWTHLLAEDTTRQEDEWHRPSTVQGVLGAKRPLGSLGTDAQAVDLPRKRR